MNLKSLCLPLLLIVTLALSSCDSFNSEPVEEFRAELVLDLPSGKADTIDLLQQPILTVDLEDTNDVLNPFTHRNSKLKGHIEFSYSRHGEEWVYDWVDIMLKGQTSHGFIGLKSVKTYFADKSDKSEKYDDLDKLTVLRERRVREENSKRLIFLKLERENTQDTSGFKLGYQVTLSKGGSIDRRNEPLVGGLYFKNIVRKNDIVANLKLEFLPDSDILTESSQKEWDDFWEAFPEAQQFVMFNNISDLQVRCYTSEDPIAKTKRIKVIGDRFLKQLSKAPKPEGYVEPEGHIAQLEALLTEPETYELDKMIHNPNIFSWDIRMGDMRFPAPAK